jgi:hypothetical protein
MQIFGITAFVLAAGVVTAAATGSFHADQVSQPASDVSCEVVGYGAGGLAPRGDSPAVQGTAIIEMSGTDCGSPVLGARYDKGTVATTTVALAE